MTEILEKTPIISVVLPAFNAERYIGATLDSILSQDGCDFEVIVVDDGSTDGTAKILQDFTDQRIKIIRVSNSGGPAKPRNVGMRAARGRYISFFDADDVMLAGKLARSVSCLEAHSEAGLLFTNFSSINEDGEFIKEDFLASYNTLYQMVPYLNRGGLAHLKSSDLLRGLNEANFIGTSSVVARRSKLYEIKGFDETLKNGDDFDCWVRLACRANALFLDERLHLYRIHSASISHSDPTRRLENLIRLHESHSRLAELPQEFRRNSELRSAGYAQNVARLSLGLNSSKARLYARKALKCGWSSKRLAFYLLSFFPNRAVQLLRLSKQIAEGR